MLSAYRPAQPPPSVEAARRVVPHATRTGCADRTVPIACDHGRGLTQEVNCDSLLGGLPPHRAHRGPQGATRAAHRRRRARADRPGRLRRGAGRGGRRAGRGRHRHRLSPLPARRPTCSPRSSARPPSARSTRVAAAAARRATGRPPSGSPPAVETFARRALRGPAAGLGADRRAGRPRGRGRAPRLPARLPRRVRRGDRRRRRRRRAPRQDPSSAPRRSSGRSARRSSAPSPRPRPSRDARGRDRLVERLLHSLGDRKGARHVEA